MIFWVEMQKARRRHDLLLCLLVPLIILLWVGGLSPESEEELANGYSALFYSLPVIHSILLPVAMAALASRLWDMEVKGGTMKLLYTLQSRRSLLMGKAVFGLLETALMTAIEMAPQLAGPSSWLHGSVSDRTVCISGGLHICGGSDAVFFRTAADDSVRQSDDRALRGDCRRTAGRVFGVHAACRQLFCAVGLFCAAERV
ncbi:MAG: ABC transporter permease [Christensenellales bacterium]